MGKTISIKVLFGIYLLLMAGKVFAFSCNVDGGSSIGAGTTSVYVNLDPVIQPGQNLVVDLSQHISCWNDYGGWYDTDHINLVQGSAFAGSLQSYKGSLYWNNVTYPFPLTTNTNVLDIGDKTPMPLPLKLYITPVGAAGGVVIKAGEVIARIHMYKIATLGSGNPRNFTWNIISNNNVVMPTGGCTVDSRNVTVDLPDFPGSAEIPLGVYCSSEQKLSFYLSGATTDSARQVFANTAPDATKASGVGVSLMRNGKILATGENVSLGVQGDRTVGITEKPSAEFLARLGERYGFTPPQAPGHAAIASMQAICTGQARALICMGATLHWQCQIGKRALYR